MQAFQNPCLRNIEDVPWSSSVGLYRGWMPWEICELFLTAQPPLLPPMNFYPPGPTFSSTMVGFNPGSVPTLVPTLSLPAVALDGKSMDVMAPSYQHTDPVTKAVLDNIMGKLPTKKIPVICRCDVCNLEFSGQVVLDTHLAGAKHAKKWKRAHTHTHSGWAECQPVRLAELHSRVLMKPASAVAKSALSSPPQTTSWVIRIQQGGPPHRLRCVCG
uniref:C2H2-type domain-containing protein n=1 Tax=Timema douglasi TaxID=61478 RepID=A0A7R8VCD6_TIMDO|nr:unnamed protein product [Timema douglasi]